MIKNMNLLESFILIPYLYMKTNITCKYIYVKIINKQMADYLDENLFEN